MKLVFSKSSSAVVMSPDSEWLGSAIQAGVRSNRFQTSGISYIYN